MSNPNFTTILSTTLNNYRKELTDNIFKDRPLSRWLMEKNRTRMLSGGVKIVEPLIYASGQAGAYGGYDQITINPQTGLTAAEYDWRQLYATIAISGIEEAQNNGKEQIVNLLEAKIMQAEETLKDAVNVMLYSNGTGAGVQGTANQQWLGLSALIAGNNAPAGTPTTVGGIDATANAYWRSIVRDNAAAALDLDVMNNVYNSASKGNDTIDAIFTTQGQYEKYEALLQPQVRYQDVKSANAGFQNLMFKNAPVFWDADCTANTMYGINSKYLTLVGHKDRWFKNSGFTENMASSGTTSGASTVSDARYALITAYGNLTVRNRARHFRLYNLAP